MSDNAKAVWMKALSVILWLGFWCFLLTSCFEKVVGT